MKGVNEKEDYTFKYIIIGNAAVGKSNISFRFTKGKFSEKYQATIGMEFTYKNVKIGEKIYRIQIWDTAGQECFKSVSRGYYKSSVCALVVYDITNRKSFDNLGIWLNDIQNNSNEVPVVLFGNKCDLFEKYEVENNEAKSFAKEHSLEYFETSAKQDINVQDGFNALARMAYEKYSGNNSIDLNKPKQKPDKKCC